MVSEWVRRLHPGYFALVMATGVVSRALAENAWHASALVLLWMWVLAFGVLTAATVWWSVRYRMELLADAVDPSRSFGFFTFVAAAGVLSSRTAAAGGLHLAVALLVVAGVTWLVLGYVIPGTLTRSNRRR